MIITYIGTSHSLAKDLLDRPDNFITATFDGEEYMIGSIKRVKTHANNDDASSHYTLNIAKKIGGNMIRWI